MSHVAIAEWVEAVKSAADQVWVPTRSQRRLLRDLQKEVVGQRRPDMIRNLIEAITSDEKGTITPLVKVRHSMPRSLRPAADPERLSGWTPTTAHAVAS